MRNSETNLKRRQAVYTTRPIRSAVVRRDFLPTVDATDAEY